MKCALTLCILYYVCVLYCVYICSSSSIFTFMLMPMLIILEQSQSSGVLNDMIGWSISSSMHRFCDLICRLETPLYLYIDLVHIETAIGDYK